METVKLNISGKLIEIEKSTLIKSGYFNTLFNGNFKKPEEPIFVPCNPDVFDDIIRFLRFNTEIDRKFQPEVEYFQISYEFMNESNESDRTQKLLEFSDNIVKFKKLFGDNSNITNIGLIRRTLEIDFEQKLVESLRNDYAQIIKSSK